MDIRIQSSIVGYIDASWMRCFAPPLLYLSLLDNKRGRRKLSKIVLGKSWPSLSDRYQFIESKEKLFRLMLYCGLAANSRLFLRVIDKRDFSFIKKVLNEDYYDFLCRCIPLTNLPSLPLLQIEENEEIRRGLFLVGFQLLSWCIEDEIAKKYMRLAVPAYIVNKAKLEKPNNMEVYLSLFEKVRNHLNY